SQPVLPALPASPLPQPVAPRENAAAIHWNVSRPPAPCSARQRVDSTSTGRDILSIGLVTTYGISFGFRLRRIRAGLSMQSCWIQLMKNFLPIRANRKARLLTAATTLIWALAACHCLAGDMDNPGP